jgi:hypothetical protein
LVEDIRHLLAGNHRGDVFTIFAGAGRTAGGKPGGDACRARSRELGAAIITAMRAKAGFMV